MVFTQILIRVSIVLFKQIRTGSEFNIPVNANLGYQYRASIRLRHQRFKIRLDNESQIGDPDLPKFDFSGPTKHLKTEH